MSTPTTNSIVLVLAEIGRDLVKTQQDIQELDVEAIRARSRFEQAFARAYIQAEGAEGLRKQKAVVETETQKLDAEIADARLRAAREHIRVLRDRLEIGRSLNSAIKSEFVAQGQAQGGIS